MAQAPTRRALFAAATTFSAVAVALAAAPALAHDTDHAALAELDKCQALLAHINATCGSEAETQRLFEMEDRIYFQPCTSMGAAIAKLSMLNISFNRGERADESEEAVMAEVIAFLRKRI